MIDYVKGELVELTPTLAVVETAGLGFALNISLNTYTDIQGLEKVKLFVHEELTTGGRDDSYIFYGFATRQERELYRMLVTVSGVGSNTARMMLSAMTPKELCNAIASGDERVLKSAKGIGLKTAQRIIVDLKDKIVASGISAEFHASPLAPDPSPFNNSVRDEAVSALTMLGFSPAPASKVVTEILTADASLPVEKVVKQALKLIK